MRSERKKGRAFLARFMVLLMVINLLSGINPNVAMAESADEQHFANNGQTVNDTDGVQLKETASGYNDGKFNVELLVNGSGSTTTQTKNLDVVLVVDRSASMEKGSRMTNAKNAATEFVNKLLTDNGGDNVRVGLVSFGGNNNDNTANPTLEFKSLQKNKAELIKAIDSYSPYPSDRPMGGTFTQAGLRKANELFGNNTNEKIIVLISDGEPTYAYSAKQLLDYNQIHRAYNNTPKPGYEIWSRSERNGKVWDDWKKGFDNSTYKSWGKKYQWTPYYVKLVPDPEVVGNGKYMDTIIQNNTISEATAIKNSGVEVFSVGIGVNDSGTYVLNQVASPGRYYASNTYANDLAKILKELHNIIINYNIVNGSLEIKMNDKVNFINNTDLIDLIVSVAKNNYSTVSQEERDSFDKRSAEIKNKNNWNWNPTSKVLTLKNITLGDKEELKVTYKAELKEEWKDGTLYPLSQTAKLNLKALTDPDNRAVNFTIPTVKDEKTVNLKVNKTWDGKIPESVANGITFDVNPSPDGKQLKVTVKPNSWSGELKAIPKYKGGKAITYTISEPASSDYKVISPEPANGQLSGTKDNAGNWKFDVKNKNTEKTSLVVTKNWVTADGKEAPADLKFAAKVQLYADGKKVDKQAAFDNNGKAEFTGLDKYNTAGDLIGYTVKEVNEKGEEESNNKITNGKFNYDVTYSYYYSNNSAVVTNKVTNPEAQTFDVTITKTWKGGVGEKAVFTFTNGTKTEKEELTKAKFGNKETWTATKSLPKYNNDGNKAVYDVTETADGFETKLTKTTVDFESPVVGATNTRETTKVTAKKIWSKNTPADLKFDVKVQLYADGEAVKDKTATIKADDATGQVTFDGLPKKKLNGTEIKYSVKELDSNGTGVEHNGTITNGEVRFKVTYDANQSGELVITNTCENPEAKTFEITLKKNWVGGVGNKAEFVFTNSATPNKPIIETLEKSESGFGGNTTWTKKVTLPKYNNNGTPASYTVKESAKGFISELNNTTVDSKTTTVEATNTREKTSVKVTKIWSENTPADLKFEVKVKLYANGNPVNDGEATIAKGKTETTFTNLPEFDEAGNKITYSVKELNNNQPVDEGGKITKSKVDFTVNYKAITADNVLEITNTCENPQNETFKVTLKKIWKDGVGKEAKFTFTSLSDTAKKYSVTLERSKFDPNNTTWTDTKELPMYDGKGNPVQYTVQEAAEGFTSVTVVEDGKVDATHNTVTATNTRDTIKKVTVTKNWSTNTPSDLKFNVTVQLYADGAPSNTAVIEKGKDTAVFENLPKTDLDGKVINYTVKELDATGKALDNNETFKNGDVKFTVTYDGSAEKGFTILNKCENPEAEKFTVKLTKIWVDGVGKSADFVFTGKAGGTIKESLTGTANLTTWTGEVKLPKYDKDGKEESYTVSESAIGYTSKVDKEKISSTDTKVTATNTRNTDTYTIKKVWADNTPKDLIQDVNVYLKGTIADKTEVVSETAIIFKDMASEGKVATFTVPTHDLAGNEITYTASEEGQNGDKATINNEPFKVEVASNGKDFTITNTYDGFESNKISVTLKKEWVGDKRDKATFTFNNEKEVTLSEDDNWEKKVELPKYSADDGKEIEYKVKETVIPGYKTTLAVNGDPISGYNPAEAYGVVDEDAVTFTNTQIKRKLTVKKVWVGTASEAAFTLTYNYDGKDMSESFKINDTDWSETLPVYDVDGKPVEYTVTEKALEGYQLKEGPQTFEFVDLTGTAGPEDKVLTFTNTKQLENKFTVHKTWVGKVASGASFGLFNGSKKVDELALTADNAVAVSANVWTGTFTKDLPSDNASGSITYVVKELDASGNPVENGNAVELGDVRYKVEGTKAQDTANTYNFTNTELKDVTVTKTWEGTVPKLTSAANFGLYKDVNGVPSKVGNVNAVVISNADNVNEWTVTFKDVVAVETDGTAITYSIKELNADGQPVSDTIKIGDNKYKVSYDDKGNIKNTELIDITVEKKWSQVPNSEDYSVEVAVFDNADKPVEKMTATLPHKDDDGKLIWKHTFENLPYIEGGYKVKETHINGESIDKFANLFKSEIDPESIAQTGNVTITNSFDIPNPGENNLNVTKYWEAGATKAAIKVQAFYKDGGKWVAAGEATEMNQTGDIWSTEITPVKPNTPSGEASGSAINPAPAVETAEPESNQPEADKTAPDANAPENETPAPEAPVTDGESASPVVKAQSENENALEGVETAPEMPSGSFEDIDFSEAKSTIYNPMAEYYVIETYIAGEDGGELTDDEIQTLLSNTQPDGKTSYKLGKYDVVVQKLAGNKTYIRNMLSVKTTRIRVEKDWKNTPDSYKKDVQVKLYKEKTGIPDIANAPNTDNNLQDTAKDTEPELEEVTGVAPLTITKGDSWLGYFNGLPKYDENGDLIKYHVAEVKIGDLTKDPVTLAEIEAGYEIGQYDVKIVGDGTEDVKVENTIKRIDVNAVKTWAAGTTKVQVEFTLYAKDGDTFKKATDSAIIAVADTMGTTFTGVPKLDEAGNEISYYVFETKIGNTEAKHNYSNNYTVKVPGGTYTVTIAPNGVTGGTDRISINNAYTPDSTGPVVPYNPPTDTPDTTPTDTPSTTPTDTTVDVPDDTTPQGDANINTDEAEDDEEEPEEAEYTGDDDVLEVDNDDVPQGTAKTKDDAVKEDPIDVDGDPTPRGPANLPKTGGTASDFLSLIGMGLIGLGLVVKKRK